MAGRKLFGNTILDTYRALTQGMDKELATKEELEELRAQIVTIAQLGKQMCLDIQQLARRLDEHVGRVKE